MIKAFTKNFYIESLKTKWKKPFCELNKKISLALKHGALFLIYIYRGAITYIFGPCCRYYPSCSEYSRQAYQRFGFLKGTFLTLKRLGRCHPLGGQGYDPLETPNAAKDL